MGGAAPALLLLLAAGLCAAQYEEYSVRGFPAAALEPLQRAYARALAQYAEAQWAESARALEASLRLHRLLRDSEAHCHRRCAAPAEGDPAEEPPAEGDPAAWEWEREMQLFGRLLRRAGCLRACKRDLPVFQLRYPPAQTLRDFQRRLPYQYLHYALFKVRRRGAPRARKCRATWLVAGGGSEGLPRAGGGGRPAPPPCTALVCASSATLRPSALPPIGHTPSPPLILHPRAAPLILCPSSSASFATPQSCVPPSRAPILHHQPAPAALHPLPPAPLYPAPRCHVFCRPAPPFLHSPSGIPPSPAPPSCLCTVARQHHLGCIRQDSNKIEKAVSAAHTFLQKNPKHEMTLKYLNYYRTMLDVDEYLVDLEAQPYEPIFVRSVKLYNNGDFRSSAADMEQALAEYYKAYENCLASCEGAYELQEFKDFYPAIADHFVSVLQCKVDCETELTPNVGGYFVEKFVATMYHYLQFAYYKLNDVRDAVRSVSSYMLFDPGDAVMQQNLVYYRFHRERWRLQEEDFEPRPEAVRYHNRTAAQKKMLDFARQYLQADDEVKGGPSTGHSRVLLGVLGWCGWVLWIPRGRALPRPGGPTPKPALEKRPRLGEELQTGLLSPAASSCRPVLQMEVDSGEGLEAQDLPSDGEFEGEGDYEEGFFAEWWQEPKTKGDKADQGS
ncbi:hypothetical protein QYF61_020189 [Mycteria americana]|uniref:Endoplasmic reticulum protein SC65 n=1 Tax=Mycteria americana TaxID=33587 RepID=A0AAN7RMI9_MYCAM|nr:hypothetical protein QYF61_020189 [Mycteria americana]